MLTMPDIEFALIQMKAETLDQINQALSRLDEGAYGYCLECGEEIPERRLRALPFADSVQGLRGGAGSGGGARRRPAA
jgi:RNA polymerase-binding transcription factor DksA